jgi:hypothetical protein
MRRLRVKPEAAGEEPLEIDHELVIGRDDADVPIPDAEVSRRHTAVRPIEAGIEVEDLGSMNGTFVDETRIDGKVTVSSNATLRVGKTQIALEVSMAPPEIAPHDLTVPRDVVPPPEVTAARPIPEDLEVTAKRAVPEDLDVTAPRAVPDDLDVTAPRAVPDDLDVTAKRAVPEDLDVTAPRPIPQDLDATAQRPVAQDPDVTAQRPGPGNLEPTAQRAAPPAAPPAAAPPAPAEQGGPPGFLGALKEQPYALLAIGVGLVVAAVLLFLL